MITRKKIPLRVGSNLDTHLFSLSVVKPQNKLNVKYMTLGSYLGKDKFKSFCKSFELFVNSLELECKFFFNQPFYSWLIVEVSKIDGVDYVELSQNDTIYLPIAGKQLSCIETECSHLEMSVVGFCDSFNFILNDSRNYLEISY